MAVDNGGKCALRRPMDCAVELAVPSATALTRQHRGLQTNVPSFDSCSYLAGRALAVRTCVRTCGILAAQSFLGIRIMQCKTRLRC